MIDFKPLRFYVEGTKAVVKRISSLAGDADAQAAELAWADLAWMVERYRPGSDALPAPVADGSLQKLSDKLRKEAACKLTKFERDRLADLCDDVELQSRGVLHKSETFVLLKPPLDLSYPRHVWVSGMVLHFMINWFQIALNRDDVASYKNTRYWLKKYSYSKAYPTNNKESAQAARFLAGSLLVLSDFQVDERRNPRRARRLKDAPT